MAEVHIFWFQLMDLTDGPIPALEKKKTGSGNPKHQPVPVDITYEKTFGTAGVLAG